MSRLNAGLIVGLVTLMAVPAAAQQQPAPPAAAPAAPIVPVPPATPPPAAPAVPAVTPPAATAPQGQTQPSSAQPQSAAPAPATPPPALPAPGATTLTEPPAGALPGETVLPPVQVIQEKPKPQPKPKLAEQPKPKSKAAAPPPPAATAPPEAATPAPVTPAIASEGSGLQPALVRLSPTSGSEIAIEKVAGSVSAVAAADIAKAATPNTTDALQQNVPGVIVNDIQGNGFQQDVQYHGFSSSSVNGSPQGLAVYQNGVRINEVFGDTMNWDMIPSVAINDMTVVTNNPVFGLNAIGGAIAINMKDGFNFHGFELDSRFGSFGRKQGSLQYGVQSGPVAAYLAMEGIRDSGWRDYGDSTVRRMYADLGFKGSDTELHLSFTGARNQFGAAAPTPLDMLDQSWTSVYSVPQTTANNLAMLSASVAHKATSTLTFSGTMYWRHFEQKHVDGNISDATECDPPNAGFLCFDEPDNLLNGGTIPIGVIPPGTVIGSIDRTGVKADSIGGTVQAVSREKLFGHANQFLIGASYDHGTLTSTASSELGFIDGNLLVHPLGIILSDDEGAVRPVRLGVKTNYYGVYLSNAFDLTDKLTLTVGGRFNLAQISMRDETGNSPDLDGDHSFQRFNPVAGATYQLVPGITLYGGYSEANRAPTPSELACADPLKPCLLEGFLVADPPLKQVVSHTFEGGLRGSHKVGFGASAGKLDWSVGYFHTENQDDIITIASAQQGRGYFSNAGTTLRQGVDVALGYRNERLSLYGGYSYTDATFQSPLTIFSPSHPGADANGDIFVQPGDHLPSVPRHKFKAGFDYWLTQKWKFGADFIATSSQYLRSDEANQLAPLPGYQVLNMHTSYDITKNVQVYGIFQNVLDQRYFNFGTLFDPSDVDPLRNLTDPRTLSPGMPFAAYGGVKIKF